MIGGEERDHIEMKGYCVIKSFLMRKAGLYVPPFQNGKLFSNLKGRMYYVVGKMP